MVHATDFTTSLLVQLSNVINYFVKFFNDNCLYIWYCLKVMSQTHTTLLRFTSAY